MIDVTIYGAGNLGLSLLSLVVSKIPHTQLRVAIIDKNQNLLNSIGKENLIDDPRANNYLKRYSENIVRINFSEEKVLDRDNTDNKHFIFVCVPSEEILECLKQIHEHKHSRRSVVICSTLFISEFEKLLNNIDAFKNSEEHKYFYMPLFIRAGHGYDDLNDAERVILGTAISSEYSIDVQNFLFKIFNKVNSSLFFLVNYKEAEALKVIHDAFIATKIVFSNEVGTLCDEHGINKHLVMKMFSSDKTFISSNKYFGSGQPYTGPYLTKNTINVLKHVNNLKSQKFYNFNLLSSIHDSNIIHILDIFYQILDLPRPVCIIGLGYKDDFNDLRESLGIQIMSLLENEYELPKENFVFKDKFINSNMDLMKFCRYNEKLFDLVKKYMFKDAEFRSYVIINNIDDRMYENIQAQNLLGLVNLLDLSNNF